MIVSEWNFEVVIAFTWSMLLYGWASVWLGGGQHQVRGPNRNLWNNSVSPMG